MKTIIIPKREYYDQAKNEFIYIDETVLNLEHSLLALSEWEAKWKKPFFSKKDRTIGELRDYVRCMTIGEKAPEIVYASISTDLLKDIFEYVNDSKTATWINERKPSGGGGTPGSRNQVITSELIYYWMVAAQVPFEAETWHLSRLFTLLRICSIKSQPNKKMSKNEVLRQNAAINAARRAKRGG